MKRFGQSVLFAIGLGCYLVAAFIPVVGTYIGQHLHPVYSQGGPDYLSPIAATGILLFTLLFGAGTAAVITASKSE